MWSVDPQDDGTYVITNTQTNESYTWVRGGDNSHVPQEVYQQIVDAMLSHYEQGGSAGVPDKQGIDDLPRGKQAFNEQFHSHSPSGFGASGGFGTQGAHWSSYSPSGWNSPGGWDLSPGPSNMWRWMQQGYDKDTAAGLTAAERFPGIQTSRRLHDQMSKDSGQDLGPYQSSYERALAEMKRRHGMGG